MRKKVKLNIEVSSYTGRHEYTIKSVVNSLSWVPGESISRDEIVNVIAEPDVTVTVTKKVR